MYFLVGGGGKQKCRLVYVNFVKFSISSTNSTDFSTQCYLGIMIISFLLFKPLTFYFLLLLCHIGERITYSILQSQSNVINQGHEIGWRDCGVIQQDLERGNGGYRWLNFIVYMYEILCQLIFERIIRKNNVFNTWSRTTRYSNAKKSINCYFKHTHTHHKKTTKDPNMR